MQKDEKLVFQKNSKKMQTCLNRIEENSSHTRIMRKIQFRSSNTFFMDQKKKHSEFNKAIKNLD